MELCDTERYRGMQEMSRDECSGGERGGVERWRERQRKGGAAEA